MANLGYTGDTTPAPSTSLAKSVMRTLGGMFGISGSQPVPEPRSKQTSTDNAGLALSKANPMGLWKAEMDRKAIYSDILRMDNEDELVSQALDVFADCCVSWGENDADALLQIKSKKPEVETVLNALILRLNLRDQMWQIARDTVRDASSFREVILNDTSTGIDTFKQVLSYEIWPNVNEKGDKISGWIYRRERDKFNVQPGIALEEWQIVPFLFGSQTGYLALPMLASARKNWIRLARVEDGMAVARLTRAYDKYLHKVPVNKGMTKDEAHALIVTYINNMSKKSVSSADGLVTQNDSPQDVQTDYYQPDDGEGKGGIEVLTSTNMQLGNLNDVIYHRERLICRLGVPIGYLQIASGQKTHIGKTNTNVERQFARRVRKLQASVKQGLRRLFDMELNLNGITPTEGLYDIIMARIEAGDQLEDAQTLLTYAQAAAYFVEAFGALPLELMADRFMRLSPEQRVVMDKFIRAYGNRVEKAKVKTIETASVKPTQGPGNNNNSKAANSSSQKPKPSSVSSQSFIDINEAADLFATLSQEMSDLLEEHGVDSPSLTQEHIKDRLIDLVLMDEE